MTDWKRNMTKQPILIAGIAIASLGMAVLGTANAAPAAIEEAKMECIVGEQNDGYIGVVDGAEAPQNLLREVKSINLQRKAAYSKLAKRNGVTIDAAAMLTAERLINDAPSGHCVQDEGGAWVEK